MSITMCRRAKSDSGRRSSEIEDAQGKTVLPIGRRMKGRLTLEGIDAALLVDRPQLWSYPTQACPFQYAESLPLRPSSS
jgi:hypothetical protein